MDVTESAVAKSALQLPIHDRMRLAELLADSVD